MWDVVVVCLLLGFSQAFGKIEEVSVKGDEESSKKIAAEQPNEKNVENFFEDLWDMTTELVGIGRSGERIAVSSSTNKSLKEGRGFKLKQKKAQLRFFMRTFLSLKVILGFLLPLGIIAAKILSWKAVTLSLIALILAKIGFVKNLLPGYNTFSTPGPQFVPPVLIHSLQNDPFWKRQSEFPLVRP